jgi:hypothetical protein
MSLRGFLTWWARHWDAGDTLLVVFILLLVALWSIT